MVDVFADKALSNQWHTPSKMLHRSYLFDHMCLSQTAQRHVISRLYLLLFASVSVNADEPVQAWDRDLGHTLTEDDWEHVNLMAHKASRKVTVQGNS